MYAALLDSKDFLYSLNAMFTSSSWVEREIWDMFGIFFINHGSLKRLLLDYGFDGYPMRKDYPVVGYFDIYYNDSLKRITYQNIELSQEFRNFNYFNNWSK